MYSLCGALAALQAPRFERPLFDPFSLFQDGFVVVRAHLVPHPSLHFQAVLAEVTMSKNGRM